MNTSSLHCIAIDTPLGNLFATANSDAVTGLYFEGQKYFPVNLPPLTAPNAVLQHLAREIAEYFSGERHTFGAQVQPHGTPFQQRVWQALLKIPRGKTLTYAEVAALLGQPTATRAVAGAIGRNPISVVIPCHRVIGRDGSLTGYAGGIERKRALLKLEIRPSPVAWPE